MKFFHTVWNTIWALSMKVIKDMEMMMMILKKMTRKKKRKIKRKRRNHKKNKNQTQRVKLKKVELLLTNPNAKTNDLCIINILHKWF